MVILGFALKGLGLVSKFAVMALAPVATVLAWGAVEQALDDRQTADGGTGR